MQDVSDKRISVSDALETLESYPYEELQFAKIDTHRPLRTGFPEVIFCKGKTTEQIAAIARRMSASDSFIMATKADSAAFAAIKSVDSRAVYHEIAKIVVAGENHSDKEQKTVLVVTGGTADIPIAEEAVVTAEVMGSNAKRLYDVGVAGLHRLLDHREMLTEAHVIITVAGMDGALASIMGGLVDKPVIAVPTSIGYGSNFEGLSALLTMLNSCSPGVTVVNIDNGFGAGYFASLIV